MNISSVTNLNFTKVSRKVLTRDPILVTQIRHPIVVNDEFSKRTTGKTNHQINNPDLMSEFVAKTRAVEFERLIQRQKLAQNRSGDILERLEHMEKVGYEGILDETPVKIYNTLLKLNKKTISALNDTQLFRICSFQDGNRSVVDGLLDLEREFTYDELVRLSQRNDSTILNTWICKQTKSEESFDCLTKYIHEISKR